MFQVDPERVLYATGAPKSPLRIWSRKKRLLKKEGTYVKMSRKEEEQKVAEMRAAEEALKAAEAEQDPDTTDKPELEPVNMKPMQEQIKELIAKAKTILKEAPVTAQQKRALRFFMKDSKALLSRAGRRNANPQEITAELSDLLSEVKLAAGGGEQSNKPESTTESPNALESLNKRELRQLEDRMAEHLQEEDDNPRDRSKPYHTPWRPRQFMSAFAFIPSYLEVNQNICSAIYLRHPVARKGSAEVPTPFTSNINQLAFNWYLRRR
jgi:hypothetical protein